MKKCFECKQSYSGCDKCTGIHVLAAIDIYNNVKVNDKVAVSGMIHTLKDDSQMQGKVGKCLRYMENGFLEIEFTCTDVSFYTPCILKVVK